MSQAIKKHMELPPESSINITKEVKTFYAVAKKFHSSRCFITDSDDVVSHFGATKNSIVVFTLEYPDGKILQFPEYLTVSGVERIVVGLSTAQVLDFSKGKAAIDSLPIKVWSFYEWNLDFFFNFFYLHMKFVILRSTSYCSSETARKTNPRRCW